MRLRGMLAGGQGQRSFCFHSQTSSFYQIVECKKRDIGLEWMMNPWKALVEGSLGKCLVSHPIRLLLPTLEMKMWGNMQMDRKLSCARVLVVNDNESVQLGI